MGLSDDISGRVWKLGDHVNTDVLHPPSYFSLSPETMVKGVQEGMRRMCTHGIESFPGQDLVIVAGENFGCGSSRETSVRALASFGVIAVVALSFARIFERSLVNQGIPALVCRHLQSGIRQGEMILVHVRKGFIEAGRGERFPILPLDFHLRRILECGGLLPYMEEEMGRKVAVPRDRTRINTNIKGTD